MTYEKALEIIEAEFDTIYCSKVNKTIKTGLSYDGARPFSLNIYNSTNGVILTDLGNTKEVFDEVSEQEWEDLCISHGFKFENFKITHEFTSIKDVYDFIAFLDFISDKFFDDFED